VSYVRKLASVAESSGGSETVPESRPERPPVGTEALPLPRELPPPFTTPGPGTTGTVRTVVLSGRCTDVDPAGITVAVPAFGVIADASVRRATLSTPGLEAGRVPGAGPTSYPAADESARAASARRSASVRKSGAQARSAASSIRGRTSCLIATPGKTDACRGRVTIWPVGQKTSVVAPRDSSVGRCSIYMNDDCRRNRSFGLTLVPWAWDQVRDSIRRGRIPAVP